jgi:hypothetical protein
VHKETKRLEAKKKDIEVDLANVNAGKKSVRTVFKSDKDSGTMQAQIEIVFILYL